MNRLIRFRLYVALAIVGMVSALAISATRPLETAPLVQAERIQAPTAIPVLPTIVVYASDDIPELPLVVVRPSAEELAAASEYPLAVSDHEGGSSQGFVGEMLPRARLDMPYYSFGKLIPSVSKD